jgi:hypothetical protein
MFDNRPTETQYFYTDDDATGAALQGSGNYSVTLPAGGEPPVRGFWSLTLYNDKHLFHPNDLKRYSVGTKNTGLKRGEDGSLTVYVGPSLPGRKTSQTGCQHRTDTSRSTSAPTGASKKSSTDPGSRPKYDRPRTRKT